MRKGAETEPTRPVIKFSTVPVTVIVIEQIGGGIGKEVEEGIPWLVLELGKEGGEEMGGRKIAGEGMMAERWRGGIGRK